MTGFWTAYARELRLVTITGRVVHAARVPRKNNPRQRWRTACERWLSADRVEEAGESDLPLCKSCGERLVGVEKYVEQEQSAAEREAREARQLVRDGDRALGRLGWIMAPSEVPR